MRYRMPVGQNQGFTLTEVLVSLALLSVAVLALQGLQLESKKSLAAVNTEVSKNLILENIYSTLQNPVAWRNTYLAPANADIKQHLTYSIKTAAIKDVLGDPAPPSQTLAVFDGMNQEIIPKIGAKYLEDGTAATSDNLDKAVFELKVQWWKGKNNTAVLAINLIYTGKNKDAAAPLYRDGFAKLFKPSLISPSCIEVETPIVAGSSGSHNNFVSSNIPVHQPVATDPGRNNFVWDHATAECPANYYLSMVYSRAGCNAVSTREFSVPSNPRLGTCHQISAQTALQMQGCSAGSNNGTCVARCCSFE